MAERKPRAKKASKRRTAANKITDLSADLDLNDGAGGWISKALVVGPGGTVIDITRGSKQINEDPFKAIAGYGESIIAPPFSLEQLSLLAETHPTHAASIEQKVSDIVGGGVTFKPPMDEGDDGGGIGERKRVEAWWESHFGDGTSVETLSGVWDDYEALGWGMMEITRDLNQKWRGALRIPGQTMRAHVDGVRFVQQRRGQSVWFKRWGTEQEFLSKDGRLVKEGETVPPELLANEILVFRKQSRRSSWYGIPIYVSAIGFITLAVSARDYNIMFFSNAREARRLITVTGLRKEVLSVIGEIERMMRTQLKDPHRHVLLPIVGEATVQVFEMGSVQKDMEFQRLIEQSDAEILTAHRMPPDRLGIVKRGFLGGSVANVTNQIYKDGVVAKGQQLLESRLTNFARVEWLREEKGELPFRVDFRDLDITDEAADAEVAIELVKSNLITLNEGRAKLGMDKHAKFGDMTLSEWLGEATGAGAFPAGMAGLNGRNMAELQGLFTSGMDNVDQLMERLLTSEQPEAEAAAAT